MKNVKSRLLAGLLSIGLSIGSVPSVTAATNAQKQSLLESSSTIRKIAQTGTVALTYRESAVPFSYVGPDKIPVGYAMDFCMQVVEALRRDLKQPLQIKYVLVTAETRLKTIMDKTADMECGSGSATAKRRKDVEFSVAYYFTGPRILVKANSGINELEDAAVKTAVATRGTQQAEHLRMLAQRGQFRGHVIEASDHGKAADILEKNEADVYFAVDTALAGQRALRKQPSAFRIAGRLHYIQPLAIALPRDDPGFKRYVDFVLSRFMTDGGGDKIYQRWFMSPIPPSGVNLDVPMHFLLREQFVWPSDATGDD